VLVKKSTVATIGFKKLQVPFWCCFHSLARVFKGNEKAGRMGNDRVTVSKLESIKIVPKKTLIE